VSGAALHGCLAHFPGAALELSADGVVRGSNGRLDDLVGQPLPGRPLDAVIDSSSRDKWRRILSGPAGVEPACTWELVFATPASLEVRTFLAVWGGADADASLWLLEYAPNPRLESLYEEMTALHGELVQAQRQLGRDRSRLARALEQAEVAVRTRDEVLAVISHDLRNPLGTITMAAGLLELPIDEGKKAEQIAIIQRAAAGMLRLIGDLLDVSSVEAGSFSLELAPVSPGRLLEEVAAMMGSHASARGQRIECRVEAELPEVPADRHRLTQALSNLVGNAVKFTPEGGTVRLSAEAAGEEVIVTVRDTGPGIPADDLPHIFDRFWHTSRVRRGGAGLGLAIAKGIVEAHGGRIWVNRPEEGGAAFSFTLPVPPLHAGQ
jgi:signal transduction histidine kinase